MRQFVFEQLSGSAEITELVGTRIYQGESLVKAEMAHPFLVYRIGNETSELMSEEEETPHRVFFQVYIHDRGGDYMRIDDLVKLIIAALQGGPFPDYKIYRVNYLETSRDLDDDTMNTLVRYVRFQAVRSDY